VWFHFKCFFPKIALLLLYVLKLFSPICFHNCCLHFLEFPFPYCPWSSVPPPNPNLWTWQKKQFSGSLAAVLMKIKSSEKNSVFICSVFAVWVNILMAMLHSDNDGSILLQNTRHYSHGNMYSIPEDLGCLRLIPYKNISNPCA